MSKVDTRRVSVDGEQVPTQATGEYGLIAIIETRDTAQVPLPDIFFRNCSGLISYNCHMSKILSRLRQLSLVLVLPPYSQVVVVVSRT